MNMQDKYDLMDRYLDGAADPSEAAELLDALRSDPSLVQEMEATVAVRDAVAADIHAIELPADLLAKVESDAAAAGFFAPTTSTIGGAGFAASSILPWIITTLTFTALLTVSMFFLDTLREESLSPASTLARATAQERGTTTERGTATEQPGSIGTTKNSGINEVNTSTNSARSSASNSIRSSSDGSDGSEGSDGSDGTYGGVPNKRNNGAMKSPAPMSVQSTTDEADDAALDAEDQAHEADDVALVTVLPVIEEDVEWTRTHDGTDNNEEAPLLLVTPEESRDRSTKFYSLGLRASLRPVTTFTYSTGGAPNSIGSAALELDAEIVPDHFFGAGVHRDLFPVLVVGADGEASQESFMTWYSAHYRWSPKVNLPMGLRPFMHLGVGGSTRGLVTQPAVGMAMNISSIRIGAGVDAVGLAFQDKGTWSMAWSPALRIELGYTF